MVSTAMGAEGDYRTQELYEPEEAAAVPARLPRPVSRFAENVSVITAEQIALLNAHTLSEVLQTVPGIQLGQLRTPGSFTFFSLNGADSRYIRLLIDGIPQNDLANNIADAGLIPVERIERVEIVKGAASAAWGSALGGVVNVITKSPDTSRKLGGNVSSSGGERSTTSLNGAVSGTVNRFGYYLSGGNLHSAGLLAGNRSNINNTFGKFSYELPNGGNLTYAVDLREALRGLDESIPRDIRDDLTDRIYQTYLKFSTPLYERLHLEMTLHATRKDEIENLGYVSTTDLWKGYRVRQSSNGGGARLIWGDNQASLVAGLEYSHDRIRQTETVQQNAVEQIDRTLDRWAGFVNGAFSIGKLTLLPGLRLDHTGVSGDNLSYTLGATWQLTEKTVVRGYGARGYSLPQINSGNGLQKIWTAQAGVESSEIPFVWLKGALFYSEIWDIEEWDYANNTTTLKEQVKQGYELEARSVPLHGFSLSGGYTFIDARDRATRERLTDVPEHSLKLALSYRHDKVGLSGALTGNYVWWYSSDATARYKAMTWDLSLTQKLPSLPLVAPELFFTGHNLFNGSQYQTELYKNTGRWLEGGVRFRF